MNKYHFKKLLPLFLIPLFSPTTLNAQGGAGPTPCDGLPEGVEKSCCVAYPTSSRLQDCCKAGFIDTDPTMTTEEDNNCDCYRPDGPPKITCFSCITPQQVEDIKLLLKINASYLSSFNPSLTQGTNKVTISLTEGGTSMTFDMPLCPCSSPEGQARFSCPAEGMGSIACLSCIHPQQVNDFTTKPYFTAPGAGIPPFTFDEEYRCYRATINQPAPNPPFDVCLPKCSCEGGAATCPPGAPPPPPPPQASQPRPQNLPLLIAQEGKNYGYLSTTGEVVILDQKTPIYTIKEIQKVPPKLMALSEAMYQMERKRGAEELARIRELSFAYLQTALPSPDSFAAEGIKAVSLPEKKIVDMSIEEISNRLLTSDKTLTIKPGGLLETPPVLAVSPSSTPPASRKKISSAAGFKILVEKLKTASYAGSTAFAGVPANALLLTSIRMEGKGGGPVSGCSLVRVKK